METNNIIQNQSFGSTCQYGYKTADFIGGGRFGNVYEATVRSRGNFTGVRFVVVKVFHLAKNKKPLINLDSWIKWIDRIKMLLHLKHKNLVVYHKITVIKARGGASVELLMEYCRGGDLASFLQRLIENETLLDQREAVHYAIDIAEGLCYLHQNNIIHGDLKPGNVFVKHITDTEERLVIGDLDDFVLMQDHQTCANDLSHLRGTYRYMSPEMLKKFTNQTLEELPGRKTDVWSLGCIILSLADRIIGRNEKWLEKDTTKLEADQIPDSSFIIKIIDGYGPFVDDSIPAELRSCIRRCLCIASTDRCSAQDVVHELDAIIKSAPTASMQRTDEPNEDENSGNTVINRLLNAENSIQMNFGAIQDETFGCKCQYEYRAADFFVRGTFSDIYIAKVTVREDFLGEDLVAVKVIRYHKRSQFNGIVQWRQQRRWWKRLLGLRHNQIAVYHKISVFGGQKEAGIEVLMEYYEGKDLGSHLKELKENGSVLLEAAALRYAMEITEGIKFLHQSNVIHGELKPRSVLVKRMESNQTRLVIGNLDNAIQMQQNKTCSRDVTSYLGVIRFMSPEMLKRYLEIGEVMPGRKTDVWSLGCIIVQLANAVMDSDKWWLQKEDQRIEAEGLTDLRYAERILNGFIPVIANSITDSILNVLVPVTQRCLCFTASERLSAADLARELRTFGNAILECIADGT